MHGPFCHNWQCRVQRTEILIVLPLLEEAHLPAIPVSLSLLGAFQFPGGCHRELRPMTAQSVTRSGCDKALHHPAVDALQVGMLQEIPERTEHAMFTARQEDRLYG